MTTPLTPSEVAKFRRMLPKRRQAENIIRLMRERNITAEEAQTLFFNLLK